MIHSFIAGMDLLQGIADQISGIDCGLGTLLCQLTDLVCHNSKASACFSGSGCFNGSIQGQQIGLACNIFDLADDIADFLGSFIDPTHDFHQVIHFGTSFIRLSRVFLCLSAGILRMFCGIVYHRSNIGNRRLKLLYGSCLFGCPLSQRLRCICQTSGTHGYLSGYFIDIVQCLIHLILNISQRFF